MGTGLLIVLGTGLWTGLGTSLGPKTLTKFSPITRRNLYADSLSHVCVETHHLTVISYGFLSLSLKSVWKYVTQQLFPMASSLSLARLCGDASLNSSFLWLPLPLSLSRTCWWLSLIKVQLTNFYLYLSTCFNVLIRNLTKHLVSFLARIALRERWVRVFTRSKNARLMSREA